jgi:restriction system protein
MAIPTFHQCIEPELRHVARRPDDASVAEIQAAVPDALGITKCERERDELLPSGTYPVYKSRIGWTHARLKRAGYSTSVRRGYWKLTAEGVALAKRSKHLSAAEVARIAAEERTIAAGSTVPNTTAPESAGKSARERVDDAVQEITEVVAADLLAMVLDVPPERFERIVLEVLHRMGYGARIQDLRRTGGAGDGGIDSEISLDRLGLERVCFQAKCTRCVIPMGEVMARG